MESEKEFADTSGQTGPNPDQRAAFPFQQDLLLAAEYFGNLRGNSHLAPEKELLLAVLADGIHCFRDNVRAQSEEKMTLFEEAREWIFSNDSGRIFSFLSICDLLDMDPEYLREGLKHWEEQGRNLADEKRRRLPLPHQLLVA